jgi:GNAT superfamily N-acetyltransferase
MSAVEEQFKVRRAKLSDARRIAVLCGQLGYPTTARQMSVRLKRALQGKNGVCFVADTKQTGIIGWIHVSITPLLEVDRRAEINGLVVDEAIRSRGAGATLLATAEDWARKKRCLGMSVRSNVIREGAHEFYLRHAYEHYKTQKAFRKQF